MAISLIPRRDFLRTCAWGAFASFSAAEFAAVLRAQEKSGKSQAIPILADMAGWIAKLSYQGLSPTAVRRGKQVLLDTLGCALGAVNAPPVRIAQQVIAAEGGNSQASVVGIGMRAACDQAAFLNGMAIRYLDYNDYAAAGTPHHCSMNVAPALAAAEMAGLGGKDLLLGMIAGYEVQLRLRDATEGGAASGWDTGSITLAYSSAALTAKLLGLNPAKIANAMAIAGAHANTLQEVRTASVANGGEMTPAKGTAEPIGIKNGVFAALLARAGLTYPLTILEGKSGYAAKVSGELKQDLLRRRSGEFEILKSCIKLWPCVVTAQAPIAAALQLKEQNAAPDEIERIDVALSEFAYNQQRDLLGEIKVREHADHSVPYTVARAFLEGKVTVGDFEENRFRDSRALELMTKMVLHSDASLSNEALGAILEVTLRNGKKLRAEVPHPPGSLENPADDKSLAAKFLSLAEPRLGASRGQKAIETILAIEGLADLRQLIDVLAIDTGRDVSQAGRSL